MEFKHISVLLEECISALKIQPDGVYVDGTAGGGGHSYEIAKRLFGGRLIALDKDPDAVKAASERLREFPCAQVVQSDFADVCDVIDDLKIDKIDGLLLDLGVSSYQMDTPERGFSYQHDAKLDMRMSQTGLSAYDIVNTYTAKDLSRILREFGEERFSAAIAANIVKFRQQQPLQTTFQLMDIVKASIPAKFRREGGNPAKRTFQAIRIAVNSELDHLSQCLDSIFERLKIGGRIAVITFHSLEDRMVKQKFTALARGCTCPPDFPVCICGNQPKAKLITKKPVEPTEEEILRNNRSRSAKLRVIEKLYEQN